MATTLGVLNSSDHEWPAQILDISPGGLCLQIPRRFEPNTLLNVFLPEEKSGTITPRVARICWTKNLPDKTCLVGCLFLSPLEDEDLDRLLFSELCTTHVARKPRKES
jgi:hypothetical protein